MHLHFVKLQVININRIQNKAKEAAAQMKKRINGNRLFVHGRAAALRLLVLNVII